MAGKSCCNSITLFHRRNFVSDGRNMSSSRLNVVVTVITTSKVQSEHFYAGIVAAIFFSGHGVCTINLSDYISLDGADDGARASPVGLHFTRSCDMLRGAGRLSAAAA